MAVVWSLLVGILARRTLSSRASSIVAVLVLSHWVLDFVTHRPDLPLWPSGPLVGLGLWHSLPATILLEGALIAIAVALYTRVTSPIDRTGTVALVLLVVLCTVIWITQPWSPPPPSSTAVALVGLALWLLPPWGGWIERHRVVAPLGRA